MKNFYHIHHNISKTIFFSVLVVLLLIPVFTKSKLLLFGERTYGEMVGQIIDEKKRGRPHYSVINFNVFDTTIEIMGAENVIYDVGTKIKIVYDKNAPSNCMIFSISYIYGGFAASMSFVLIIIWFAIYTSFKKKKAVQSKFGMNFVLYNSKPCNG